MYKYNLLQVNPYIEINVLTVFFFFFPRGRIYRKVVNIYLINFPGN